MIDAQSKFDKIEAERKDEIQKKKAEQQRELHSANVYQTYIDKLPPNPDQSYLRTLKDLVELGNKLAEELGKDIKELEKPITVAQNEYGDAIKTLADCARKFGIKFNPFK